MEKELISKQAFAQATHLERFQFAANALMSLTGINKINQLYERATGNEGLAFVESIFDQLNISFQLDENELKRIPKSGKFITVSNHPFGALDGLLLLYIVSKVRPDFKVMANFLLKEVQPISHSFIAVNPFENRKEAASSLAGMKEAMSFLEQGAGLGIFPAGEVSSFQTNQRQIADKQWMNSAIKLIKKAEAPIVPIYFEGSNSLLFQLLGLIHPSLRTIALPTEMLRKKRSTLKVRIGKKIAVEDQQNCDSIHQLGRFLRAKTYSLGSSLKVQPFFFEEEKKKRAVCKAIPKEILQKEITEIDEFKLSQKAEFNLYLAPAKYIPNLLNEIGRLREISFREVGEGTNTSIDLDEYDLYYHHLFLWDKDKQAIAGAYRLGKGNDIFRTYGKKGFYIHSLFKLKNEFSPILKQSIEMGRSFVVKDYQQKRLPLFMLWKGIMHFILTNPEYKYLIGPVSISGSYTQLSRMIMVQFIKQFYFNKKLAEFVTPRKKFKVSFKKVEGNELVENAKSSVKKIDQVISDIEPNHAPIPVLIKKYLKQNAKIIGFNLDPKFNDALDGLMILDLDDLPQESIEELKKDMLS